MKLIPTLIASAALVAAVGANATVTGSLGGGTGTFLPLSSTALDGIATISGGTFYSADHSFASMPEGMSIGGDFLAAGIVAGTTATISFTSPTNYVSFLWGSPDVENLLTVTTSSGAAQTFTATSLNFAVKDGDQSFSQYVQFSATAGSTISSLSFTNLPNRNAFESANFSITAPVPEPETYALMLAGLGALCFVSRRRRSV